MALMSGSRYRTVFRGRWSDSLLARNARSVLVGNLIRLAVQALYFVLLARSLGADGYGAFASVLALASIGAPFAGLGSGNLLVKNVSCDKNKLAAYWWNGLLTTLVSGLTLTGALVFLSQWLVRDSIPIGVVLGVGLSELVLARIVVLSAMAFQAFEHLVRTVQLLLLLSVCRLAAIGVLMGTTGFVSPMRWTVFYVVSSGLAAAGTIVAVRRGLNTRTHARAIRLSEIPEGLLFSTGNSAQAVHNDLDKAMLARFTSLGTAGSYTAGYRVVEAVLLPIESLFTAAYARFFRHGQAGLRASLPFARRLVAYTSGYALVAAICIFLFAPFLPTVLGPDYAESAQTLRLLMLLPLLRTLHYVAANLLAGAGELRLLSAAQVLVAGFSVVLNLILIPEFAWRGAAWATLTSEAVLAVALWTLVRARTGIRPTAARLEPMGGRFLTFRELADQGGET